MIKDRNLRSVFNQWGGKTATFFSYIHFNHDLCLGLLAALLPLIKEGLGLNYLQSGLLLSALTITSGLSQFPGGWLGDRFSRHKVIAIGLAGVGLTTLAVGLSPAYYPMLFILIIMGIFSGAYHPSAVSVLSSQVDYDRRGKAIAFHMVGGSIGFAIGPIIGGIIAEMMGWRFAFIILSIPAMVAIPFVLKKFRQSTITKDRSPQNIKDDTTTKSKRQRISIVQALRPIAIIFALVIIMHLVVGCAMAFIPIYLVDKHSVIPAYAAMLIGVTRGGGIAGSLLGGWLSDRWDRKRTIFLALAAIGPILYLLTKLPFNAGLITTLVLFGMIMYMRTAAIQALLMDTVPPYLRATVYGIFFGLCTEGVSLIQPVAGYFMDIFGIVEVFNGIALTSLGLSAVALFLAMKPKSSETNRVIS